MNLPLYFFKLKDALVNLLSSSSLREYSGRIDFNSFSDFNNRASIEVILSHIS